MFRTIQGFKGLEADVVILLNHLKEETLDNKQLYVGYTRARFYLYVIEILQA
jgi:DNA helicase IV